MARAINAEYVKRGDLPSLPASQVVVDHSENTRLYEPDFSDLVEAFKTEGQLQPCIVRPLADGKLQLVAGYRRWMAADFIEKEQAAAGVPPEDRFKLAVVVQKMSPTEALDRNVSENQNRSSLSPVEAAHTIRRLRIAHGWNDNPGTEKIAAIFKTSVYWVDETEELLGLTEAQQFEIHKHFTSKGKEGLKKSVALVLRNVPEEKQEEVLEEARQASMAGKKNTPAGKKKASSDKSEKPLTKSQGNAKIKVRDITKAAEKAGAANLKDRTVKDMKEMISSYFDGSEALRKLHPVTNELLERIGGFFTRKFTEAQFDRTVMKIDGCMAEYYAKYMEKQLKKS